MAETKLESRLGTVLYHNEDTVLSSPITLSESAANFSYLKIFFKSNDTDYNSVDVYHPDGKRVSLMTCRSGGNYVQWLKTKVMTISGTTITTALTESATVYATAQSQLAPNVVAYYGDYVNITTVLGFR